MKIGKYILLFFVVFFLSFQNFAQNNRTGFNSVLHQPPEVDFSWVNACLGDTTDFINGSIRGITYQWFVYDKNMIKLDSSINTNISYLFPAVDTFYVYLEADNGHVSSALEMIIIDTVTTADFNFMHCSNQFINHSTCATSFFWDFGDGSTSTIDVPVHQYTDTGSYTVKFKASKGIYSDSVTKQIYVDPIAFPTGAITYYLSNDTLFVHAIDSGAGMSYNWKFGDFTPNVYVRDTFHVYANPGTYIMYFSNWNACNTAYSTDTIVVVTNSINTISHMSSSVTIFPNPVSVNSFLNISYYSNQQYKGRLTIYDVFGKISIEKEYNFKIGNNEFKINTVDFPVGMYFIELVGDNRNTRLKFLVKPN